MKAKGKKKNEEAGEELYAVAYSGVMIVSAKDENEAIDKFFDEDHFRNDVSLDVTSVNELIDPKELY